MLAKAKAPKVLIAVILYKPTVDEWALYDNSDDKPILVEEGVNP